MKYCELIILDRRKHVPTLKYLLVLERVVVLVQKNACLQWNIAYSTIEFPHLGNAINSTIQPHSEYCIYEKFEDSLQTKATI